MDTQGSHVQNQSLKFGGGVLVKLLPTVSLEHKYVHYSLIPPTHALRENSAILGVGRGLWGCKVGMNV